MLDVHYYDNQSGLCPHCDDPEHLDHAFFFYSETYIIHKWDLKATMFNRAPDNRDY